MIVKERPPRSFRARWVLPIDQPPIRDGWIQISGDRIAAVGGGRSPDAARDLGDVALMPGLVNAHTHLELSWMANLVPPASSMADWIQTLLRVRRTGPAADGESEAAATHVAGTMVASGTVLVGDISNSGMTASVLNAVGLGGVVFRELLGFNHADPGGAVREAWSQSTESPEIAYSVVAHAPYSVSPALFRAIAAARRHAPLAVHLAESLDEMEFVRTGGGPMREMLERLGVWD